MTERRMEAYYYGFAPTGNDHVDAILEAVARAGKAYHHTEDWNDKPEWGDGKSEVERIQEAAHAAAKAFQEEQGGAEILDEEGMAANDKLARLAYLILNCDLGTEKGLRAKHYAEYCLGQRMDDPEGQTSKGTDNADI